MCVCACVRARACVHESVCPKTFKNVLKFVYAVLRAQCTIAMTRPLVLRLLLRFHAQAAGVWKTDAVNL